jgi:hypothetical protein
LTNEIRVRNVNCAPNHPGGREALPPADEVSERERDVLA